MTPDADQVLRDVWAESLNDATLRFGLEQAERVMHETRKAHEVATAQWSRLLAEKCRREDKSSGT